MKPSDLLPAGNSTIWEKTMAEVMVTHGGLLLVNQINGIRGTKLINPPPSLLPFLIYEYGLGELTPYVPNLYDLIDEGIDWQRLRGTPAALAMGLGWLDYTAILHEESPTIRHWNLFQLELDRVRDEFADLDRIDGIANLSVPERSYFWRGYRYYDVRPLVYGMTAWGNTLYGEYSGIRMRPGGPLWSFGRPYEFDTTIARTDLELIDAWVEPDWTQYDDALTWGEFSWDSSGATWESGTSEAHSSAMANILFARRVWIAFIDANDVVIGYRRARAKHFVSPSIDGPYSIGASHYSIDSPGATIYIEAMTGFGEGNGRTATKVGLVFGGTPIPALKPGTAWLTPSQIVNPGPPVAVKAVSIAMGESIRERVKYVLRLDGAYELPLAMQALGEDDGVEIFFLDDSYAERF